MENVFGTVLIVDDHPFVLDAMTRMIGSLDLNLNVVACNSAESGMVQAETIADLKLIIIDYGLPGISGNTAIKIFHQRFPNIPIAVISGSDDRHVILGAKRSGATTYISKTVDSDKVRNVIRRILVEDTSHDVWAAQTTDVKPSEVFNKNLTKRQQDILFYLMKGYSNKEIAFHTELAEITVKMHVSAVFKVLGVINRTQAVMMAQRMGLIDDAGIGFQTYICCN